MANPKAPSRAELFKIFGKQELVVTFEKLFEKAGDESPLAIETLTVLVAAAQDNSNSNSAEISVMRDRLKSHEVLLWLTTQ